VFQKNNMAENQYGGQKSAILRYTVGDALPIGFRYVILMAQSSFLNSETIFCVILIRFQAFIPSISYVLRLRNSKQVSNEATESTVFNNIVYHISEESI